jgi:hypothetical protein
MMELLDDVGHVESHFGSLGAVLLSGQNSCMICAKCTIASEIVSDAPGGTPR